jgi:hypothetical protein
LAGLTATRFGAGTITAPSVGAVTIKGHTKLAIPGDFAADVNVSGTGLKAGVPAFRALSAAGEVTAGSDVSVAGTMTRVVAGTFNGSITAGGLAAMTVKGKMAGDLTLTGTGVATGKPALGALTVAVQMMPEADVTAPSIGTFVVKGIMNGDVTVTGTGVLPEKPAVKTLKVAGAIAGSTISVDGGIGLFQVGAFRDSRLYAGYSGPDDGTGTFKAGVTVGTFKVTDEVWGFEDSLVFATALKTVLLNHVTTDNGGNKFGFVADEGVGSLKVINPELFTYVPTDPSEQGLLDFKVRIV